MTYKDRMSGYPSFAILLGAIIVAGVSQAEDGDVNPPQATDARTTPAVMTSSTPPACRLVTSDDYIPDVTSLVEGGAKLIEVKVDVEDVTSHRLRDLLSHVYKPDMWAKVTGRAGK